jgi:glycerophosphoryl diester phosphodiesterase
MRKPCLAAGQVQLTSGPILISITTDTISAMPTDRTAWPYPRWIAHRGAGTLAPENTLAAIRLGAHLGYRMFECDVQLSQDGVPFLLHDATLDRTTDGHGPAAQASWRQLSLRDAGHWHSPAYAGEPLVPLEAVMAWCLQHGVMVNLELKPSPGQARATGRAVAERVGREWPPAASSALPSPLLSSFEPEALAAARDAAPHLPRALLLEAGQPGWVEMAHSLGCIAIVGDHRWIDASVAAQVRQQGWRLLAYTVNEAMQAQRLWALGVDGLITDRVDTFNPNG